MMRGVKKSNWKSRLYSSVVNIAVVICTMPMKVTFLFAIIREK